MSVDAQEFGTVSLERSEAALTELLRDQVQNYGSSNGQVPLAPSL